jgi:homoserine dehydrogenase
MDRRDVRVGLLGYGRVGQAVAAVIEGRRTDLRAAGIELAIVGALVRDAGRPRGGPALPLFADVSALWPPHVDVMVEVMGGREPARTLIAAALEHGVPVVTANKTVMAHHGDEFRELAAARLTTCASEAAVMAGVPFLGALGRRPLVASAARLEGVVNGTSHFVLERMAAGVSLQAALDEAVRLGCAEPDADADLSGRDAVEKLVVLLHTMGHASVAVADVPRRSIATVTAADLAAAARAGGVIKPVVVAAAGAAAGAWVGPALVDRGHPLAALTGFDNALRVIGRSGRAVTFAGPGAGPEATAESIVDDVVEVVLSSRPSGPPRRAAAPAGGTAWTSPPGSAWFIALHGGSPNSRHVAEFLAAEGLPATRIEPWPNGMAVRTSCGSWDLAERSAGALAAVAERALLLPVLEAAVAPVSDGGGSCRP